MSIVAVYGLPWALEQNVSTQSRLAVRMLCLSCKDSVHRWKLSLHHGLLVHRHVLSLRIELCAPQSLPVNLDWHANPESCPLVSETAQLLQAQPGFTPPKELMQSSFREHRTQHILQNGITVRR